MIKNRLPFFTTAGASPLSVLVAASLIVQAAPLKGEGSYYSAIAIGAQGSGSFGYDINNSGHVVGTISSTGRYRPFVFADGAVTILDPSQTGTAHGINNLGQIVGVMGNEAFLYSDGVMLSLGNPSPEGDSRPVNSSTATAINDAGLVTISSRHQGGYYTGHIYNSKTSSIYTVPLGERHSRMLTGINENGTVTGTTMTQYGIGNTSSYFFRYGYGTDQSYEEVTIGATGFSPAINDHGVIAVTNWMSSTDARGIIHDPHTGLTRTLTAFVGESPGARTSAEDINNAGQVVGMSMYEMPDRWTQRAYVFDNGVMRNLTDRVLDGLEENIILYDAYAINDWGQIVAQGRNINDASGAGQAYLLNPHSFLTAVSEEEGATTLNIKALSGMDYSDYEAPEPPAGSLEAKLIAGTAGANRDIRLTYTGEGTFGVLGEVIELTGTEDDLFVLQLSFDPALVSDPSSLYLGWLDPDDGVWKNAVAGNSSDFEQFILGAFNEEYFELGYYGVDLINHHVWAVLDHNSSFGVVGAIPEPSTWTCLLLGGIGMIVWTRRRSAGKAKV